MVRSSSDLGGGPDGQPPQSPEGQEAAQNGGHQASAWCFRTISAAAAAVLAGFPPFELWL